MINVDNKHLVSIVVPVFNVEAYLCRCLNSIQNQTYNNYEVIMVDDGSTDSSGKIVDSFAQSDSRFIAIHITNSGVSAARNIGMHKAKGDYICFIDSDDWVKDNYLERLIATILKHDCDIVQIGYESIYDSGKTVEHVEHKDTFVTDTKKILLLYAKGIIQNSLVTKIFKKSLLNNLKLNEEIAIGEDADFVFRSCKKSNSIFIMKESLYCYYQRSNSAINSPFNLKKLQYLYVLDSQMDDTICGDEIINQLKHRRILVGGDLLVEAKRNHINCSEIATLKKYEKKHVFEYITDSRVNIKNKIKLLWALL